ncbi:TetR/AcrR family transcriptional regulator [Lachnospiraceae bacterium 54-53]
MGQTERKQLEQEIRRKDILDAAERVFFSRGYDNASMDEVAKEAEFSKRTVYVYFNSKEQIYFEIMIRGYHLLLEMLERDFNEQKPGNALAELRCIFFSFYNFRENWSMYFKAIMEYETKDADARPGVDESSKNECYRLGEQLLGYLSRAIQKGVEEGSLKKSLVPEKSALILWACTTGIFNISDKKAEYLKNYHQVDPKELIEDYFNMIMGFLNGNGEI